MIGMEEDHSKPNDPEKRPVLLGTEHLCSGRSPPCEGLYLRIFVAHSLSLSDTIININRIDEVYGTRIQNPIFFGESFARKCMYCLRLATSLTFYTGWGKQEKSDTENAVTRLNNSPYLRS